MYCRLRAWVVRVLAMPLWRMQSKTYNKHNPTGDATPPAMTAANGGHMVPAPEKAPGMLSGCDTKETGLF